MISPVSDDVAQLANANRTILFAGMLGLFSTGLILLAVLWKPMNRIRKLALALPALELAVELPEAQRRAFREVVLEGRSLDALAADGARSATGIARAARLALLRVLEVVEQPGRGEPGTAGERAP